MKTILCYKCDDNADALIFTRFVKTLFHSRGKCVVCGRKKAGFIVEEPKPGKTKKADDEAPEGLEPGDAYCPYCNEKIENLYYTLSGYEYGSTDLDGDNMESDGFDTDGSDTNYTCPNCHDELDPSDVRYVTEKDDDEAGEDKPLTE